MFIERFFNKIAFFYFFLLTTLLYRPFLKSSGSRVIIWAPHVFTGKRFVTIGEKVVIRYGARIEVLKTSDRFDPILDIGNNVNIEQNVHIVCGSKIIIGNNVSITGNVAIVDVEHPYEDISNPLKIGARIKAENNFVFIGDGAFIGFGAVILPNVKIGKGAVIGSNSVVNKDVPDFSVAAGNPVKIIRKFNLISSRWERT